MGEQRIIVAHPGRQHSFRLASALKKSHMLLYYVTTIYDNDSLLMNSIKKFLSSDNLKRANNRKNNDLEKHDVIQYCELWGMIEAFLSRYPKFKKVYYIIQRKNADRFGLKVAKLAIKHRADAVIMYDSNALKCFEYLSKNAPYIKRIMDVSSAGRPFRKELYQKEVEKSGYDDLKRENSYMWEAKPMERMKKELLLTEYFLVPSSFVGKSLLFSGVSEDQLLLVPYGANVSSDFTRRRKNSEPVHFLFAGNINYNKGILYLLKAMKDVIGANLTLTGAYDPNAEFLKNYLDMPNVNFTGRVTFDKMKDIYEHADVFVIDSFSEGMAQVGIEAMACGLPIICSTNSGVNDLVEDYKNGFIIQPGEAEALREKMQWFVDNSQQISFMGENAKKTACCYTWEQYEKNVVGAINNVLKR